MEQEEHWHLSKSVPVSILLFMLVQTVAVVIWATRIDARVDALERWNVLQDQRIVKLEDIYSKIAVIEDRQANVIRRLDIQTTRMDQIISILGKPSLPKN